MLNNADRRPARNDLPPRRMRATVPAHSKPECTGVLLCELDELIKRNSQGAGEIPSGEEYTLTDPLTRTEARSLPTTRGHLRHRRPDPRGDTRPREIPI